MVATAVSNKCEKSLHPTQCTLSMAFFSGTQSLSGLIPKMPFKRPNCWVAVSSKHSLLHACKPPVHSTERLLTFIFFHYCHITCWFKKNKNNIFLHINSVTIYPSFTISTCASIFPIVLKSGLATEGCWSNSRFKLNKLYMLHMVLWRCFLPETDK